MGGTGDLRAMGGGQGGPPDMNSMLSMMQDPGMNQMMRSMMAQPGMLEHLTAMNPQLQQMLDANPAMRCARLLTGSKPVMGEVKPTTSWQDSSWQAVPRELPARGGWPHWGTRDSQLRKLLVRARKPAPCWD